MVREMSDVAAKRFHFKKVNLRAAACLLLLPFLLLLSATMPRVGAGAAAGCAPWP